MRIEIYEQTRKEYSLKPMNRIQWTEGLRNRRTYRVSQKLLADQVSFEGSWPKTIRFNRADDLTALEIASRILVENLLKNDHIESVELGRFDIIVVTSDFSFGRHNLHGFCLGTIHQYLWGQDADVLISQETFLP